MGLLGQKKKKQAALAEAGNQALAPKGKARKRKGKDSGESLQGYDLTKPLPDDAPLNVRLAKSLREDPKRLKQLFVSWAENPEGEEEHA